MQSYMSTVSKGTLNNIRYFKQKAGIILEYKSQQGTAREQSEWAKGCALNNELPFIGTQYNSILRSVLIQFIKKNLR